MMKSTLAVLAASLVTGTQLLAGTIEKVVQPVTQPYDPTEHWELDYESGVLWKFGHQATPLNYVFVPQVITLKTPVHKNWPLFGGDITLRSRASFLAEPITVGPEHYFFGITGSGEVEWWNASRTFSMFFTSGGGKGYMDSKGYQIAGAQGRNWNSTWFMYSGCRYRFAEHVSLSLGCHYQHISNQDTNKINPGVNAIGPMMSLGWHF